MTTRYCHICNTVQMEEDFPILNRGRSYACYDCRERGLTNEDRHTLRLVARRRYKYRQADGVGSGA
jgi:hypothetical protein